MQINPTTTSIGELALEIPNAINVLEKWKIDYCCHGNQTIAEACRTAGTTAEAVLAEIGVPRTAETKQWEKEPLAGLTYFIVTTHHHFTREILDTLQLLSEKVATRHGANHPETHAVRRLVVEVYDDLIPHMLKEEQVLFPYIGQLETAVSNGNEPPVPFFGTVRNPIRMMMAEHDVVGDKLRELRTVTNDYALPGDACLSFRALYERLMDLEQDLHRHIHLENNLLFPRAAAMEEQARPLASSFNEHCCA